MRNQIVCSWFGGWGGGTLHEAGLRVDDPAHERRGRRAEEGAPTFEQGVGVKKRRAFVRGFGSCAVLDLLPSFPSRPSGLQIPKRYSNHPVSVFS